LGAKEGDVQVKIFGGVEKGRFGAKPDEWKTQSFEGKKTNTLLTENAHGNKSFFWGKKKKRKKEEKGP